MLALMAMLCCPVLCRDTPASLNVCVGWAAIAAMVFTIARWTCGTWDPSDQQVIDSHLWLWYVIITGTAGMMVASHLEDQAITTATRVSVQTVALAMFYFTFADIRMVLAALGLLIWYQWGSTVVNTVLR
jgi:hypothetical protein